ncbi:hypothetical protein GQ44DRAFT_685872 [Phaeosphaeriaceae sp. PMI808]|nr:hypothetical protein GQ44DRAFT_685872 [Phaeosphaeriaceae sp. PMI808]
MAVRLQGWLEETIATQLLLGNNWLQQKNSQRSSGVKSETDRAWRGLYHDNGSCLDIINDIDPERNSYLQILSPYVLTDGQTHILPHFSPGCLDSLHRAQATLRLYSIIAVRKYTIRYTSYGPPREHLRLILQAVHYQGNGADQVLEAYGNNNEPFLPLWSQEIAHILCQLSTTRAREDIRCLDGDNVLPEEAATMAPNREGPNEGSSQPSTQFAPPRRPQPITDEPQYIGTKSLEPVLAGNTKREELRPSRVPNSKGRQAQLLGLLNKVQLTGTTEQHHLQKLASECPWMKDVEFSREAFEVPHSQQVILRNQESWHYPPVGFQFPNGNIPIKNLLVFQQLADEKAAEEAGPDSDDEMEEDPSPDSVGSPDPSSVSVAAPTQGDQFESTQVSWSRSPTPEPPKMPVRRANDLPPDSSFEVPEQNAKVDFKKASEPSPIIVVDSSDEEGQNAPVSSPLKGSPNVLDDEDCDIEMEEHVPQGLGEDTLEGAKEVQEPSQMRASPSLESVVQVEETPCSKSKYGQPTAQDTTVQPLKPASGTTPKTSSSESIVYGTYKDKKPTANPSRPEIEVSAQANGENQEISQLEKQRHANAEIGSQVPDESILEISMDDVAMPEMLPIERREELVVFSDEQELVAVKEETLSPTPGPSKRKLNHSPSKNSTRQTKRREIKVVGFGDGQPSSVDPMSSLHRFRDEAYQAFKEKRNSNTSFKGRPRSATAPEEPWSGNAMETDLPNIPPNHDPAPGMSPRHMSLYDVPSPPKPIEADGLEYLYCPVPGCSRPGTSSSTGAQPQLQPTVADNSNEPSLAVFESFKAAYPEYTGDIKHFRGQCTQMVILDKEDKMVPKWQWDDYIIRNRTDYKKYALECVDAGENPEPYHRFYKDTIRNTLHKQGIIEDRNTLLTALQQLEACTPAPPPPVTPSSRFTHKDRRPRHSLPTPFDRPRFHPSATKSHQQRYSSPRSALTNPPRFGLDGATSQSTSPVAATATDSADRFRDFFFASQRLASWTGSTDVSSRVKERSMPE